MYNDQISKQRATSTFVIIPRSLLKLPWEKCYAIVPSNIRVMGVDSNDHISKQRAMSTFVVIANKHFSITFIVCALTIDSFEIKRKHTKIL